MNSKKGPRIIDHNLEDREKEMKSRILIALVFVGVAMASLGGAAWYAVHEYGSVKKFIMEKYPTKEYLVEQANEKAAQAKKALEAIRFKEEEAKLKKLAPEFCSNVAEFAVVAVDARDKQTEIGKVEEVILRHIAKIDSSRDTPAPVEIVTYYGEVTNVVYASPITKFDAYKKNSIGMREKSA